MGKVRSGNITSVGWVWCKEFGLGIIKVTHIQLWGEASGQWFYGYRSPVSTQITLTKLN